MPVSENVDRLGSAPASTQHAQPALPCTRRGQPAGSYLPLPLRSLRYDARCRADDTLGRYRAGGTVHRSPIRLTARGRTAPRRGAARAFPSASPAPPPTHPPLPRSVSANAVSRGEVHLGRVSLHSAITSAARLHGYLCCMYIREYGYRIYLFDAS